MLCSNRTWTKFTKVEQACNHAEYRTITAFEGFLNCPKLSCYLWKIGNITVVVAMIDRIKGFRCNTLQAVLRAVILFIGKMYGWTVKTSV